MSIKGDFKARYKCGYGIIGQNGANSIKKLNETAASGMVHIFNSSQLARLKV